MVAELEHKEVEVTLLQESGAGRAFLFLIDGTRYLALAERALKELSVQGRVILLSLPNFSAGEVEHVAVAVLKKLKELKIRQASCVGFGSSASVVQSIALSESKMVRTMILIDSTTRPHPSRLLRWVDKIERTLPLGLPLRLSNSGFDSKPFLHRLRCPALVCTTDLATAFERSEGDLLECRLPTAWRVLFRSSISDLDSASKELAKLCSDFYEVPAKCPQKAA